MKTSLVTTFLACLIAVATLQSTAQEKNQSFVSLQAGTGIPSGMYADFAATGFGFTLDAKKFVVKRLALGGQVGYFTMAGLIPASDDSTEKSLNHHLIPVMGTLGYYFGSEKFLTGGVLAIGFTRYEVTKTVKGETISTSAFKSCIAPHIQSLVRITPRLSLAVSGSYYIFFGDIVDFKYFGLTAGVAWKL